MEFLVYLWAGPFLLRCGICVRPGFSWRRALENSLSVALSTLLAGHPMYVLVYCAANFVEVRWSEMEWLVSLAA